VTAATDWRSWGRYPDPVDFSNSLRRYLLPVVLCLLISLVAAGAIWSGYATAISWLGLLAALAGAVFLAAVGLQRRAVLRLDADGIHDSSRGIGREVFVPWVEVVEAAKITIAGSVMIGVRVRDPGGFIQALPPAKQHLARANMAFGTPMWISASGLSDPDGVVMLINDYRQTWADAHAQR
jgi:hypothetical protein